MSGQGGTKPGGHSISSAKKKRLAALEQSLSGAAAKSAGGPAASGPTRPAPSPVAGPSRSHQTTSNTSRKHQQQQKRKRPSEQDLSTGSFRSQGGAGNAADRPRKQHGKTTEQPWEPIYDPLPDELRTGPVAEALGIRPPGAPGPSGLPAIMNMLEELLSSNPRPIDVQGVINSRLKDKVVLLENPVGQDKKGARNRKKTAAQLGLATRSMRRKAGLYDLKNAGLTYASVLPLHNRWLQYFRSISHGTANLKELHQRVAEADLHGCALTVTESSQARLQGLGGIVVADTQHTLQVVTMDDRFVLVPKQGSTFEFDLDGRRVVTLIGSNLVGGKK